MVSHLVTQSFHQSHNRTSDASLSIKRWLLLIGLTVVSTFMFEHSEIDVSISELFYHNGHWLIEKNAQPFRFMLTSAVNNGEKHLVDFIRQPDGKSLGILE